MSMIEETAVAAMETKRKKFKPPFLLNGPTTIMMNAINDNSCNREQEQNSIYSLWGVFINDLTQKEPI